MSTNIDIHHLAAAYALDAVDDRERAAFEAHYPSCDVCRADVLEYRDTLAQLADAAPLAPGPDVRERVLAEIARTRQLSPLLPDGVGELAERRHHRRRVMSTLLAAAAAMVLVVAGALLVSRDDQPTFADELAVVLAQPDARLVPLDGSDAATVRVVWSDDADQAAFLADDLPEAPAGQAYELWLIDDTGAVPMHVLDPAVDGVVRATFEIEASPIAWGVTLEPAEGSATPTGEILFVAEA